MLTVVLWVVIANPCVLGTRPVLPCKNGYFCKLELVRAKSMLVFQYSCNFSGVGCSQVELSYQRRQRCLPHFVRQEKKTVHSLVPALTLTLLTIRPSLRTTSTLYGLMYFCNPHRLLLRLVSYDTVLL